jgi:hypothetical protein
MTTFLQLWFLLSNSQSSDELQVKKRSGGLAPDL